MIIGYLIEKFIEYSRLYTLLSLYLDLLCMFEYKIDTLPFDRLSEYYWSIGKEVEFLRKIYHIPIEDSIHTDIWLSKDFIPFIENEDDSFFFFHSRSYDMLILMRDSFICIYDDRDDICSLDRSLCSEYTPLFYIS